VCVTVSYRPLTSVLDLGKFSLSQEKLIWFRLRQKKTLELLIWWYSSVEPTVHLQSPFVFSLRFWLFITIFQRPMLPQTICHALHHLNWTYFPMYSVIFSREVSLSYEMFLQINWPECFFNQAFLADNGRDWNRTQEHAILRPNKNHPLSTQALYLGKTIKSYWNIFPRL